MGIAKLFIENLGNPNFFVGNHGKHKNLLYKMLGIKNLYRNSEKLKNFVIEKIGNRKNFRRKSCDLGNFLLKILGKEYFLQQILGTAKFF